jgi:hypothetical protein
VDSPEVHKGLSLSGLPDSMGGFVFCMATQGFNGDKERVQEVSLAYVSRESLADFG